MDSLKLVTILGNLNFFGMCNSLPEDQVKVVSSQDFKLLIGTRITILFNNSNTAVVPKLNINDTGDKPILYKGNPCPTNILSMNSIREFVYDGTSYHLIASSSTFIISNEGNNSAIEEAKNIGTIIWQYTLFDKYLALDGSILENASVDYFDLLTFFQNNSLVAGSTTDYDSNKALCYYNESEDKLTLPNFIGKTIWGSETAVEKEAGLPNIKGSFRLSTGSLGSTIDLNWLSGDGVLFKHFSSNSAWRTGGGGNVTTQTAVYGISFDVSAYNDIYGSSESVQPPAIGLIPQIKYK